MDRLTFDGNFCDISRCQGEYRMTSECAEGPCSQRQVWERLKAYEDTGLEPELCAEYKKFEDEAVGKGVTFKRIVELIEAEKDGRLVVLPCKVGDLVYMPVGRFGITGFEADKCDGFHIARDGILQIKAQCYTGNHGTYGVPGKTVFLTREEAEVALKGGDD